MSYKDYLEHSQDSSRRFLWGLTAIHILGGIIFLMWMYFDKGEALRTWGYIGWIITWISMPLNLILGLICLLGLDGPNEVDKIMMRGEEIMREQGKR